VVETGRLPDQDIDVLDGSTNGLVHDTRDLASQGSFLLVAPALTDVALDDRHFFLLIAAQCR
jgi:hypothetical protein